MTLCARARLAIFLALGFWGASLLASCGDDGGSGGDFAGQGELFGDTCRIIESSSSVRGDTPVRAETIVSGLEVPWGLAFLPGDGLSFLVTERPGRVRIFRDGALRPEPVATLSVGESGEGGLLGIALHPGFSSNRQFFVYYTAPDNVNRLDRYALAADFASASFERRILDGIPAGTFHNGGRIRLGPDGMLYLGTGDARDPDLSQDPASLAGKILRITPEGAPAPGNPDPSSAVFISGVRNIQGFDWLNDSSLVIADHGPSGELGRSGHDEVTVAQGGANLGWPTAWRCDGAPGTVTPTLVWREAFPPGGAAIYRGAEVAEWRGDVFLGGLLSRNLQRLVTRFDGDRVIFERGEAYFQGDPPEGLGRIREVISGPDGFLYLTTSNCDGRGSCGDAKDSVVRVRLR